MHRVGSRWLLFATLVALSACGGSAAAPANTSSAAPAANSGGSSAAVAADANHQTEIGETPPEFPSTDPNRWVNGTPTTLASLRGNVVLVESWHRL